jgi:glucose-6-phosphate 1-dehydrogenase
MLELRSNLAAQGQVIDETALDKLEKHMSIFLMDILEPDDYPKLKGHLDSIEVEMGKCCQKIFYMAIPSTIFWPIINGDGLNSGCQHHDDNKADCHRKPLAMT